MFLTRFAYAAIFSMVYMQLSDTIWILSSTFFEALKSTLLATNISPSQDTFEDDFPLPKVGYVVPWRVEYFGFPIGDSKHFSPE